MPLPVVSNEIFSSISAEIESPREVIKRIDKENPVLSLALSRYISACPIEAQTYLVFLAGFQYKLLESQAEADDLNKSWPIKE